MRIIGMEVDEKTMIMSENPIQSPSAEYLSVAETAKLVRGALAKAFPGQKFYVKSNSYAGGASIDIHYRGGPAAGEVEEAINPYKGGDFDGMIDLKYSRYSWLAKDGSASRAWSPGTLGNAGSDPEEMGDAHAAGCRYVRFGADFIFVKREADDAEYWAAIVTYEKLSGKVIRHDDYEDSERVRTDRKNRRGQWVYKYEPRGRKVSKLYCFEGKSAEALPDLNDLDAVIEYISSGITYGFLENRHAGNIQEPPLVVAMSEVERAERAKYGY